MFIKVGSPFLSRNNTEENHGKNLISDSEKQKPEALWLYLFPEEKSSCQVSVAKVVFAVTFLVPAADE
ncbi:Atp-Dependent Dna Helicase Q5 [Manis pentadactyla]|nr:Atp-Dependent Dna Helicase Q5 [Manis pentadactyla]